MAHSTTQPSTGPCSASECDWSVILSAGYGVSGYTENWQGDPDVTANGPIEDIIKESLKENCACGSTLIQVQRNETRKHTVKVTLTVGAGAEAEAGASVLAASIKTKVYANVELSGGWEGEWTESWTTTISKTFQECWRQTYRLKKDKYTGATCEIEIAKCRMTTHDNNGDPANDWTCGKETITGDGTGWTNEVEGWYGESDCISPTPPCGS